MDWVLRALLMTDVERSTRLWQEDAAAMAEAISRHDAIVAEVVAAHGGQLIKARGEGDSTFSVFASAADAAGAAVSLNLAITSEPWALSRPIRVRGAVHFGNVEDRAGDFYGPEVNLCARLRATAHPGQMLAAGAVVRHVDLHGSRLPFDAVPLGKHRLKDLAETVEVFQLNPPRSVETFEPIASLNSSAGSLPQFASEFMFREAELDDLSLLLHRQNLVSIVGPGGVGKSRLAVEAARRFTAWTPDGAHFVDLAATRPEEHLPGVLSAGLKLRAEASVSVESLAADLAQREMCIVLDGCEHLASALIPLLKRLMQACANITVLVTSRSTLKLTGEQVFRLPPLAVPLSGADMEAIENSPAVGFFVSRAVMARHDFTVTPKNARSIATICTQLDGIPAALEMAAIRVRSLSPEQIEARLSNRFRMLSQEGAVNSLKALFDWSWDALSPSEQRFAWCATQFEGSFDLDAAELVCERFEAYESARTATIPGADMASAKVDPYAAIDYIDSLVEKSLLVAEEADSTMRYRLSSTFREYARDKWLDAAARAGLERAHAEHFRDKAAASTAAQVHLDAKNYARAIEHFISTPAPALAAELALFMSGHWQFAGAYAEGSRTMLRCLEICQGPEHAVARARLVNAIGSFSYNLGQFAAARTHLTEAVQTAARIGDAALRSKALNNLALLDMAEGHNESAIRSLEEVVPYERAQGDDDPLSRTLSNLGYLLILVGDLGRAKAVLEEALQVTGRSDNKQGAIPCLCNLSDLALEQQDLELSAGYAQRGMDYAEELKNNVGAACCMANLGEIELRRGDLDRAESLLRTALVRCIDMSASWMVGSVLDLLGIVFWRKGSHDPAMLALVHRKVASTLPSPPRFAAEANEIYALVEKRVGPEAIARSRHRAEMSGVSSLLDDLPRAPSRGEIVVTKIAVK
ncbi:MAG: tetratricopeptide repeat protein [Fimbriimonadaceae bacterium]